MGVKKKILKDFTHFSMYSVFSLTCVRLKKTIFDNLAFKQIIFGPAYDFLGVVEL